MKSFIRLLFLSLIFSISQQGYAAKMTIAQANQYAQERIQNFPELYHTLTHFFDGQFRLHAKQIVTGKDAYSFEIDAKKVESIINEELLPIKTYRLNEHKNSYELFQNRHKIINYLFERAKNKFFAGFFQQDLHLRNEWTAQFEVKDLDQKQISFMVNQLHVAIEKNHQDFLHDFNHACDTFFKSCIKPLLEQEAERVAQEKKRLEQIKHNQFKTFYTEHEKEINTQLKQKIEIKVSELLTQAFNDEFLLKNCYLLKKAHHRQSPPIRGELRLPFPPFDSWNHRCCGLPKKTFVQELLQESSYLQTQIHIHVNDFLSQLTQLLSRNILLLSITQESEIDNALNKLLTSELAQKKYATMMQHFKTLQESKDALLFGIPLKCDEQIITAYQENRASYVDLISKNPYKQNGYLNNIACLNRLNECGCLTTRQIGHITKTDLKEQQHQKRKYMEEKTLVGEYLETIFIEEIIQKFPNKEANLNYVSLGSGNLLQDLRLLTLLEKAGYQNITIILVDDEYNNCCKKYASGDAITMHDNNGSVEQFCAYFAASRSMKVKMIIYPSLEAYLVDQEKINPDILLSIDSFGIDRHCRKMNKGVFLSLKSKGMYSDECLITTSKEIITFSKW